MSISWELKETEGLEKRHFIVKRPDLAKPQNHDDLLSSDHPRRKEERREGARALHKHNASLGD